ncbi:hypothetical protein LEP1GSC060_0090 [Leptospira weilii serovar Ranarum str. ICFT]|uniref:Uncharacterized protein n=2 Tax=Leptospira weilii TaxID=28184 RepID=N1WF46_9LEPT|nr:hypothetical protein LEP1GSC060_0090 [Leptospira weilii serovar Ranarum str. ICFT]
METVPGEKGMELFAVLTINAVISVVLYYTITSKVTERIRSHMLKRINEEIRDFVDELETESLRQVDLMGSRILTFKEMISKAEELVKRIERVTTPDLLDKIRIENLNSENQSQESSNRFFDERPYISSTRTEEEKPTLKNAKVANGEKATLRNVNAAHVPDSVQQGIGHIYKENLDLIGEEGERPNIHVGPASVARKNTTHNSYIQKQQSNPAAPQKNSRPQNKSESVSPGSTSNLVLETIGRGVRKFFGIREIKTIREEDDSALNDFFPGTRNSTLDISLDEDPFAPVLDSTLSATPNFKDNLKSTEGDFTKIFRDNITGYTPPKPDSTRISAEATLLEIAEDSTKIEKVVFLLKRKYTHEEISEVLDLALGEVDIIERFRLDRNRRF